jgi:hypothetical protein
MTRYKKPVKLILNPISLSYMFFNSLFMHKTVKWYCASTTASATNTEAQLPWPIYNVMSARMDISINNTRSVKPRITPV